MQWLRKLSGLVPALALAGRALLRERRCLSCGLPFVPAAAIPAALANPAPFANTARPGLLPAPLCPACAVSMPRREAGYCPDCGAVAAWPGLPIAPCGQCLGEAPPWQALYFHGVFAGNLRRMVHRLKYARGLAEGACLGQLLAWHPGLALEAESAAPLVVPVPLHQKRLGSRGYNQSMEIGRGLVRNLNRNLARPLHLTPAILHRIRNNRPQIGLSRVERQENTRGIFAVQGEVTGLHILLVDDVFTTGATLSEATRTLLGAGAARVAVAVVARAMRCNRSFIA